MLDLLKKIWFYFEKKTLVKINKLILKNKISKFCGNCVCDNHAKRRRANP